MNPGRFSAVAGVGARLPGWPIWTGIPGRFQPEQVAEMNRNGWPI
jgi:hypothetical protein